MRVLILLLNLHFHVFTVLLLVQVPHLTVCVFHYQNRVTQMLLSNLLKYTGLLVYLVLRFVDIVVKPTCIKLYF